MGVAARAGARGGAEAEAELASGGWSTERKLELERGSICTIPRVDASRLTHGQLVERLRRSEPAIVAGAFPGEGDPVWAANWSKAKLLRGCANVPPDATDSHFAEFCATQQDRDSRASFDPEWFTFDKEFLRLAGAEGRFPRPPAWLAEALPDADPVLSLGPIGGGLPFHKHGATWNVLAFGAKRWFMHPPGWPVARKLSRDYVLDVHPQLPPEQRPLECMQRQGEMVYTPHQWQHLTINTMETIALPALVRAEVVRPGPAAHEL